MFISLVLNTEYGNIQSRKLFYLQNLKFCAKNKGIIISYEYMKSHFDELRQGSSEQLLKSWDIDDIDTLGVEKVEQYYFPDSLIDSVEGQFKSRTEAIFEMFEKDIPELSNCFNGFIDDIKKKHPNEKIEGLFCVQEPLGFVRKVCQKHNVPIIPYFFSALRQPHGYRETLYYVNLKDWLYSTNEPQKRYENFLAESKLQFVLSHKELIALLGKIRTFPLLPYINIEPKYELGVCCEAWSVIPQYFSRGRVTDDDIFFDADKHFDKKQLKVRSHALQLDEIQVDRTFVHNDPASYILSCRRLAAVRSQILLKALLWGRTTIAYSDMLGFSFLCAKKINSIETVDINALNWYLFGYLVPHDLMFSHDYWRWRLTNPSESEIYNYHINHLMKMFNLSMDCMADDRGDRYHSILINRFDDTELIDIICSMDNSDDSSSIDFDNTISKFEINQKSFWRINKIKDNRYYCYCKVNTDVIESLKFFPFDDVAGIGRIEKIIINGKEVETSTPMIFFEKAKGYIDLFPFIQNELSGYSNCKIEIVWEAEAISHFLNTRLKK